MTPQLGVTKKMNNQVEKNEQVEQIEQIEKAIAHAKRFKYIINPKIDEDGFYAYAKEMPNVFGSGTTELESRQDATNAVAQTLMQYSQENSRFPVPKHENRTEAVSVKMSPSLKIHLKTYAEEREVTMSKVICDLLVLQCVPVDD